MESVERIRQRLRCALDLYEAGERIMRQNIRRRFPHLPGEEMEARLALGQSTSARCDRSIVTVGLAGTPLQQATARASASQTSRILCALSTAILRMQ